MARRPRRNRVTVPAGWSASIGGHPEARATEEHPDCRNASRQSASARILIVGRTPWSAADALVGLPPLPKNLDLRTKERSRETRADQGDPPHNLCRILPLPTLLL